MPGLYESSISDMPDTQKFPTIRASRIPIHWHSGLPVYASETYLKSVGDDYGWIGGFDDSGMLRCILPYTVIRRGIFRMVRFRIETIPQVENFDIQEEKSFLNNSLEILRSLGADMIVPAPASTIFRIFPDGAVGAPYGSFIVDLTQPEEALWSNLHAKHRNKVRIAMKNGVEIRCGIEYLDTAYELVRNTLKRSKMGFMRFEKFKRFVLNLNENVKIFVADYQGVAQGCAVVPFSMHGAYYLYGGSIPSPLSGAMNLLQWEALRHFSGLGVKRYDFVGVRINPEKGSKQEGLRAFKQRFGGQLAQGYMWKYSFHPIKFAVYCLAVRLLRGGDIVDLERHKLNQFD